MRIDRRREIHTWIYVHIREWERSEVEGERRDGGVLDDRLDCSHRIGPARGVSQPEAKARSRREGEGTENRSESNSGLEREQ